ncbi:hypothetical protein [Veillonella sp.]|uniref:hypothetical protein n=1 Tax=Veillonella sp. TaxID=1926307 RepID=UPI002914AA23|nr:hypothetical protein [Veillonella sp.]MDU4008887.1 hypothetical protein [Veillonella sp.]
MVEMNEEAVSVYEENSTVEVETESSNYPSACFLLDSCVQDYQRLQENYNRIYDKINVALAFTGVVLTIMLGSFDFAPAKLCVKDVTVASLIIIVVELICLVGGMGLTLISIVYLLTLLRGRKIAVFKSEDIRNEEIYREKESHAAMWLIDKYTRIVNEVRPVVQKKQEAFDKALVGIIVGIIVYVIAIILRKGGF